jgi:hypothetical protein
VQIDSTRDNSIATKPNSFWLPPDQRRPSRPLVFKMRDVSRHKSMDVLQAGSLRFDVRLANDRAEVVILFSKKRGKVHAAYLDWIKPLGYKLRPDLWPLHLPH